MFANQISKKWYLGVLSFYISLIVKAELNIISVYINGCEYFLSTNYSAIYMSILLYIPKSDFEYIYICYCFSIF